MNKTLNAFLISFIIHIFMISSFLYAASKFTQEKRTLLDLESFQLLSYQESKKLEDDEVSKNKKELKKTIKPQIKKVDTNKQKIKNNTKVLKKRAFTKSKKSEILSKKVEENRGIKKVVKKATKEEKRRKIEYIKPKKIVMQKKSKSVNNYKHKYLQTNLEHIIKAIQKYKTYPRKAKKRAIEGKTILSCILTKEGIIKELSILKTSGFDILDENSKEILLLASKKFNKPKEDIQLKIPFAYSLN